MENGKIQKNEKLLKTLENLHHIFLYSKNEQLKIYKVQNGEINETIKNKQIGGENEINNSLISNNNNNINFNEDKNLTNKKNNIIFKDKEAMEQNDNILNIKDNNIKSNIFNFEAKIKPNNNSLKINETSYNIKPNNNSMSTNKNTNSKQIFTFGNEPESSYLF